jgi:hypothetical protein
MAKTVIAAFLWMLVGIMLGSFLERQTAQPTNVVRQPTNAEGYSAQRVQSAAAIKVPSVDVPVQKKANDVGSEQKPPAPPKNMMCFLATAPFDDAEVLFYPDDTPDCLHRPHIDPSWQTALFRHLHQHRSYLSKTQSQGMVLLGFTINRIGLFLNPEIVTVKIGRVFSREIVRNSGQSDNEAVSMIDRVEPLPAFPDSMTEAKLDLIVPIYRAETQTPPQLERLIFPR